MFPQIDQDLIEYAKDDDALFHYTKKKTIIKHIIPEKKLLLSHYYETNDPWEYKFRLLNANGSFQCKQNQHLYADIHPLIDKIIRYEWRIGCFSSSNKPKLFLEDNRYVEDEYSNNSGWCKTRMWSQYGDNHKGACLVLSKSKLNDILMRITVNHKENYIIYTQGRMPYRAFTIWTSPEFVDS
jgi:hypothetical protein